MYLKIAMLTKYSHSSILPVAKSIKDRFEEYGCEDLYSRLEIREKVGSKFVKPTYDSRILMVMIGGWRLAKQQRNAVSINIPDWLNGEGYGNMSVHEPSSNALITYNNVPVCEIFEKGIVNILLDIVALKEIAPRSYADIVDHIVVSYIKMMHDIDINDRLKAREAKKQADIMSLLIGMVDRKASSYAINVDSLDEKISQCERLLNGYYKDRKEAIIKHEAFREASLKATDNVKREIELISNLDQVSSMDIDPTEDAIIIHTKPMYMRNAGMRYYLGRMIITMKIDDGKVRFKNIDNPRKSYWGARCQHPHVSDKGDPCWGNADMPVRECIREGEYLAAVTVIMGFLESVNTSDPAGKNVTRWDVVDEEGNVIINGYDPNRPPAEINLKRCYGCGELKPNSDIVMSANNRSVCGECAPRFFTCPSCNCIEYVADAYTCEDCGIVVCEDCEYDHECEDSTEYTNCPECGEEIPEDEMTSCNYCHESMCSNCAESHCDDEKGNDDDDNDDDDDDDDERCPHCNDGVSEDNLMTCEKCGSQGCGDCITFNGMYTCPNCR